MTDALIAAHGEVDKLMPYLHLPVQSGSNRILKAMNRSHTAETYLAILEKMRAARPDIALSGDFIVGFPGETEEDFEATLQIVDAVRYASAYSFKYSPRPGTPGRSDGGPDPARDHGRPAAAAAGPDQRAPARVQPLEGRACDTQILIERKGRHAGPDDRPVAVAPVGPCRDRRAGPATCIDVTLDRRRAEQHDRRAAPAGGRLMARRDLAAVAPMMPAAPGSSSSSSSPICSGRCSAITTAT